MTRGCNSNGHNMRTCSTRGVGGGGGGVRLFGVRLTDGPLIKKSASMGNLSQNSSTTDSLDGYHSDDVELDLGFTACRRPIRKKGVPWTEQEHRQFLLGLQKLGRGNWRGIARNFIRSRTPTQVASHAQKYFVRQSSANERKKRPSLFDLAPDMETNSSKPEEFGISSPAVGTDNGKLVHSSSQAAETNNSLPSLDLSLKPAFTPFPFQLWQPNTYSLKDCGAGTSQLHIHRPVPVFREEPAQEMVGISLLSLRETGGVQIESSPSSLRVSAKP